MCTQIRSFGIPPIPHCNCKNISKLEGICGGVEHKELGTFLPEFMGVWRSEAHVRVTNSWSTLTVQSK